MTQSNIYLYAIRLGETKSLRDADKHLVKIKKRIIAKIAIILIYREEKSLENQ